MHGSVHGTVLWVVRYVVPDLALKTKLKASGVLSWDW